MKLTLESEDLEELQQWLIADPELAGVEMTPVLTDPGDERPMSLLVASLTLVMPNLLALGSLITSVAAYRDSRQRSTGEAPRVAIRNVDTVVFVEGNGSAALDELGDPDSAD